MGSRGRDAVLVDILLGVQLRLESLDLSDGVEHLSSVRSVPLGQVVVNVLAAHLANYPAADDGSIFTNEHGRPLTYEL